MVRVANELQNVHCRIDVRTESLAQVRVEICKTGAVYDDI